MWRHFNAQGILGPCHHHHHQASKASLFDGDRRYIPRLSCTSGVFCRLDFSSLTRIRLISLNALIPHATMIYRANNSLLGVSFFF